MSEVKVNKISPRTNCGTVTLGDSGDSFVIPAGATITNNGTQTGFGRTGTVDWDTTAKTASFTAVSGNGYFVNTTSGAITVTLPASPSAGDIVSLADYTNTWQTNAVTVARNGSLIGGVSADATLSTQGQSVTFVYVDGTEGWKNVQDSTSNVTGAVPFMVATVTGACNTLVTAPCCANTKIATFVGPGTFCVSQIAIGPTAPANNIVSYMVVAGGAGGGRAAGGGGGAGGFREGKSPVTPYTASSLNAPTGLEITSSGGIPITVGAGGTAPGNPPNDGGQGSNSIFSTITSAGGGAGGGRGCEGHNGGSGGGYGADSGHYDYAGTGNTPPVSPPQGNPGGGPLTPGPTPVPTGACHGTGGGGATAAGSPWPGTRGQGTNGGAGVSSSITGSSVARAGGGGGAGCSNGPDTGGSGGTGGGGPGGNSSTNGTAGTTNTGGGGGGSRLCGAAGGSGIVVIRYKFQ